MGGEEGGSICRLDSDIPGTDRRLRLRTNFQHQRPDGHFPQKILQFYESSLIKEVTCCKVKTHEKYVLIRISPEAWRIQKVRTDSDDIKSSIVCC